MPARNASPRRSCQNRSGSPAARPRPKRIPMTIPQTMSSRGSRVHATSAAPRGLRVSTAREYGRGRAARKPAERRSGEAARGGQQVEAELADPVVGGGGAEIGVAGLALGIDDVEVGGGALAVAEVRHV